MKLTSFQVPEIRDENDRVLQQGTYGKRTPLCNSHNMGVLDFINNNLMAHQNAIESLGVNIDENGNPIVSDYITESLEKVKKEAETSLIDSINKRLDEVKDTLGSATSFYVKGTHTLSTNHWEGTLSTVTSLHNGLAIDYWLPKAPTNQEVTLNLFFSDGSSSGEKPCYVGGLKRLTDEVKANTICRLTYQTINIGGVDYSGWWVLKNSVGNISVIGTGNILTNVDASDAGNVVITKGNLTWDNLYDKPETFPPEAHNHDDRYYTESEIDSKLDGKANLSGATFTGMVESKKTDVAFKHTNGTSIGFGVGSGKVNRGIWDYTNNKWAFYLASDQYPLLSQSPPTTDSSYKIATTGFVKAQGYITNSNLYEANLQWGGKNFSGSYAPIDSAMIPTLSANRFAFLKPEGITIEYTRDNGETWIDYGSSNNSKVALFTDVGAMHFIGKCDSTNKATEHGTDYQLRVTVTSDLAKIYTVLNKFAIYVSTSGSSQTTCTIMGRLKSNEEAGKDVWATFAENIAISGWSGWNIINISNKTTYGNTSSKSSQYVDIRFLFKADGGNATYNGMGISKIFAFGGVGWTTPSNLAGKGTIYSYDASQNVTFPASVTATTITEGGQTLATKYTNKIETIKVNGTALPISAKSVNVDLSGKQDSMTEVTNEEILAIFNS